ncbi:iron ABC transporter ATP-binding protein [Leifsonia sp. 2MCAF36]|uniref:iron ABC transporter ATP-binding protein n=1 Tax=Leifsonia sp. 2MCAF36 TaxID=3232988 RepID=UPI003F95938A
MTTTTRRFALLAAATVAGLAVAVALAGCTPSASPAPSASRTANGNGSAGGAAATSTPKASLPVVTPTAPTTPVSLTCPQVVTADQLYAYNPNYGIDPNYTPKSGSLEKKIADWRGATCGWLNQTSKDVIQIAVAKPPVDVMESLKNAAITDSQPVPTYGVPPQVEGYFKPGAAGQVQIFRGPYWIVAESSAFFEPGDAAPLMASVLGNVPAS